MDARPLLTIAIPTYNRAPVLDLALGALLPQLEGFRDQIELIVSDNASPDATDAVIRRHLAAAALPRMRHFVQTQNTGYFGNFKTCRELSSGRFFWLLSDNDHVNDGTITRVMQALASAPDAGALYLHSRPTIPPRRSHVSFRSLGQEHAEFALMLISAVIVRNAKRRDAEIFRRFEGNTFLGFVYFAAAMEASPEITVIEGDLLHSYPTTVGFDIFRSWTTDISACVEFMQEIGALDATTRNALVTGYLRRVVYYHVYFYLARGELYGRQYGPPAALKATLDRYYGENDYYRAHIAPLFTVPRAWLTAKYYGEAVMRRVGAALSKRRTG